MYSIKYKKSHSSVTEILYIQHHSPKGIPNLAMECDLPWNTLISPHSPVTCLNSLGMYSKTYTNAKNFRKMFSLPSQMVGTTVQLLEFCDCTSQLDYWVRLSCWDWAILRPTELDTQCYFGLAMCQFSSVFLQLDLYISWQLKLAAFW